MNVIDNILVTSEQPENHKTEALILFRFEAQEELTPLETQIDGDINNQISRALEDGDFKGKAHEIFMFYPAKPFAARRVYLVGLGKSEKYSLEVVRTVAATTARKIQDTGHKDFSIYLPTLLREHDDPISVAKEFVIGSALSLYKFTQLKSKKENGQSIEAIQIVTDQDQDLEALRGAVDTGLKITKGVYLTRDLVNWPANFATPTFLANEATALAQALNLKVEIYDEDKIKALGMGAFMAVTLGTDEPAKFIVLELNADKPDLDTIVLVGKGVTFDSGGISIKPADGMERMKTDMAGAAAVLGAMKSAALLEIPLHVVALIPSTENMLNGKAYKPADVVKAMNGKTIEVINTDAEGRMLLADALCHAAQYKPKAVVDIATLTGARIVALGDHAIGLFSNSDDLSAKLEKAGAATYERVWRMPLFDEYREQLNSYVADIKHSGGRPGGSITAAKFLQEFVDGYDWAHLDIAGLVSNEKNKFYTPGWATGIGARLLTQFLIDWK